jgi:hypothetical protein
MPDGRPLMPRIRMPRFTRPGRASRGPNADEETASTKAVSKPDEAAPGNGAEPATKEVRPADDAAGDAPAKERAPAGAGATSATAAGPGAAAASPTTGAKPAETATATEPSLTERVEGLQGWMADLERKQARLTYFGGLALLLALGAAGAALYFGLTAHNDSAKKGDLGALTDRVNSLQSAVSKNSKDTQNALNASIAQLQQSISGLQKQQSTAQQTLSALQSQVNAAQLSAKNAAPVTPGTGTTTTTPGGTNK